MVARHYMVSGEVTDEADDLMARVEQVEEISAEPTGRYTAFRIER